MITTDELHFLIMFFGYAGAVFIIGGIIAAINWWCKNGASYLAQRKQIAANIQRVEKELDKFADLTAEQEDLLANILLISGSSLLGENLFNHKTITFEQLYALNMQRLVNNTPHAEEYVGFMESANPM